MRLIHLGHRLRVSHFARIGVLQAEVPKIRESTPVHLSAVVVDSPICLWITMQRVIRHVVVKPRVLMLDELHQHVWVVVALRRDVVLGGGLEELSAASGAQLVAGVVAGLEHDALRIDGLRDGVVRDGVLVVAAAVAVNGVLLLLLLRHFCVIRIFFIVFISTTTKDLFVLNGTHLAFQPSDETRSVNALLTQASPLPEIKLTCAGLSPSRCACGAAAPSTGRFSGDGAAARCGTPRDADTHRSWRGRPGRAPAYADGTEASELVSQYSNGVVK